MVLSGDSSLGACLDFEGKVPQSCDTTAGRSPAFGHVREWSKLAPTLSDLGSPLVPRARRWALAEAAAAAVSGRFEDYRRGATVVVALAGRTYDRPMPADRSFVQDVPSRPVHWQVLPR